MAANSLGNIFRFTTWGESHGKAIGVVIDGCPAGLSLSDDDINQALDRRAPGKTPYTSPRQEKDRGEILSGVFEGETTGAPISILIANKDADSSKYEAIKALFRPGHANYTYIEKYGNFDYRGGGRASARETAARVAAGAVAQKLLATQDITILAYMKSIGSVTALDVPSELAPLKAAIDDSPVFCPDEKAAQAMMAEIETVKAEGDSVGGVIEFLASGLPVGLGDPVYEKLEANLAKAMMSLPATKGFEIGQGFAAAAMRGSAHNDAFKEEAGQTALASNLAGGTLGGISTGEDVLGRVAFKPTSSIKKPQQTVDLSGKPQTFVLPEGSRHDPCVAIRAVPIVEAMVALVLVDAWLLNRCVRLDKGE